jgi:hypothetical protein
MRGLWSSWFRSRNAAFGAWRTAPHGRGPVTDCMSRGAVFRPRPISPVLRSVEDTGKKQWKRHARRPHTTSKDQSVCPHRASSSPLVARRAMGHPLTVAALCRKPLTGPRLSWSGVFVAGYVSAGPRDAFGGSKPMRWDVHRPLDILFSTSNNGQVVEQAPGWFPGA